MIELLRRIIMCGEKSQNNGLVLSVDVEYISIGSRRVLIALDGRPCYTYSPTRPQDNKSDMGFFILKFFEQNPYNLFSIIPKSQYIYKNNIYDGGEEIVFDIPYIPFYYSEKICLLDKPNVSQYYCDLTFDYNGGGNNRRVIFNYCGLGEAILGRIDIVNSGINVNIFNDFKIVNVVSATDYYGIYAKTSFICDGVLYTAGQQLDVPWANPTSTKITKRIYF